VRGAEARVHGALFTISRIRSTKRSLASLFTTNTRTGVGAELPGAEDKLSTSACAISSRPFVRRSGEDDDRVRARHLEIDQSPGGVRGRLERRPAARDPVKAVAATRGSATTEGRARGSGVDRLVDGGLAAAARHAAGDRACRFRAEARFGGVGGIRVMPMRLFAAGLS
jgi:hypothetical protein